MSRKKTRNTCFLVIFFKIYSGKKKTFLGNLRSLQVNGVLGEGTWKEESVGIHLWLRFLMFSRLKFTRKSL